MDIVWSINKNIPMIDFGFFVKTVNKKQKAYVRLLLTVRTVFILSGYVCHNLDFVVSLFLAYQPS